MSHINLYSIPTDHKNMIRCRFCEKIYKVDNGSSGFIRHLRCKHPDVLYKMGGSAEFPAEEPKMSYNNLFIKKGEVGTLLNNNISVLGDEEDLMMLKEVSSNQILANFVSRMDFGGSDVTRVAEKRLRVSPTPTPTSSAIKSEADHRQEEPEIQLFNGGDPLQTFLLDIDNHVRRQNRELQESNGIGEAGPSVLETANSRKGSREPSPNNSLLGEMNGGKDAADSPLQPVHNPLLPFGCVFCPCSFARVKDLTIHVSHVHRTRFRCNTCLAEFVQPQHLEHHYTMAHSIGRASPAVVTTASSN